MGASHHLETKPVPLLQFPDPDDVLKDFHATYASPILPLIKDYLQGPDGRTEDEFRRIETYFYRRLSNANEIEAKLIAEWCKSEDYINLNAKELHPQVCVFQGILHRYGISVPINCQDAYYYFEKAGCYPMAQALLGNLYQYGEGVDIDIGRAEQLYLSAMKANCSLAFFYMGSLYLDLYKNLKKAEECYKQAINLGSISAESHLGRLFHIESDIIPNALALQYHVIAARKGNIYGLFHLALHFYTNNELFKAEKYFLPLVEREHPESLYCLCKIFLKKGGEENIRKAKIFLTKSAELNNIDALILLGEECFVENEHKQAATYFNKSIELSFVYFNVVPHIRLYQIYRYGCRGITRSYELAAFHARKYAVKDMNPLCDLYAVHHDNPSVCYHSAVAGILTANNDFQRLLNSPTPELNKCYIKAKDTPYILKAHISESTVCQILCSDESLRSMPQFLSVLINLVIEYIGPISPFALQVVEEEKISKPLIAEMKKVLTTSAGLFGDANLQRRKMAIEFAELNLISSATALALALEISQKDDKTVFKNLFDIGMDMLLKQSRDPVERNLIAKIIFEYLGPNEWPVTEAKDMESQVKPAFEGLKYVLTKCMTLFGRNALNDRLIAIQHAEDGEVSYQEGLKNALKIFY